MFMKHYWTQYPFDVKNAVQIMTGVESVPFNTFNGIALNIIIPSPILPAVRAYLLEEDA